MLVPPLPVDVDTSYADSGTGDVTVKLHQQHHDTVHTIVNRQPVNVMVYGAVADSNGTVGNGTDNAAAFATAFVAANAQGLGVYAPPGKYRLSGPLTVAKGQVLSGAGGGHVLDRASAATTLVFDNAVNGVILAGWAAQLTGIMLIGGTGAVNGVTLSNAALTRCVDVTVIGFGQDGYNCDTSVSGNSNLPFCSRVGAYGCGRDGFHLAGTNSNAGVFINCHAIANSNAGISVVGASRSTFVGAWLDSNVTNGIVDGGIGNLYDAYVESGTGATLNVTSAGVWGVFHGRFYAMPAVTGDATALLSWTVDNGVVNRGHVYVGDSTGDAAGKVYAVESGKVAPAWFSIRNNDDNVYVMRAETVTPAAYWNAHVYPETNAIYDIGTTTRKWRDLFLSGILHMPTYTTAGRPSASTAGVGAAYYDTTVSKPVWSTGAAWHDASGAVV